MANIPATERRQQIVDAAIHVIATEGLHAATTRRITEAAGVSLGSLHYAFHSKDEIFEAILAHYTTSGTGIYNRLKSGIGLETGIRQSAHNALEWLIAESEIHLAQYELILWAVRTPGKAHLADTLFNDHFELVTAQYRRVAEPADPDVKVLRRIAAVAISMFDGLALQFFANHDEGMARELTRLHSELLVNLARSELGHEHEMLVQDSS